jgi:hypothetical protein
MMTAGSVVGQNIQPSVARVGRQRILLNHGSSPNNSDGVA